MIVYIPQNKIAIGYLVNEEVIISPYNICPSGIKQEKATSIKVLIHQDYVEQWAEELELKKVKPEYNWKVSKDYCNKIATGYLINEELFISPNDYYPEDTNLEKATKMRVLIHGLCIELWEEELESGQIQPEYDWEDVRNMPVRTLEETLRQVNEWIKINKPNSEEMKEDSMIISTTKYRKNIDIAYYRLSKQENGKTYLLECDKAGIVDEVDVEEETPIEEMHILNLIWELEDSRYEKKVIKNFQS